MDFDPPTYQQYKCTGISEELIKSGRVINATKADGNCLFRALCKGVVGTEDFHYSMRAVLFQFIANNSNIFLPHIKAKHPCIKSVNDYCSEKSKDGSWGTDIEILAASTMLQIPVFTYSLNHRKCYRWLRYLPLSPPSSIACEYDHLVLSLIHVSKREQYHLELLHYQESHYDLIMSQNQKNLHFPSMSDFTPHIAID